MYWITERKLDLLVVSGIPNTNSVHRFGKTDHSTATVGFTKVIYSAQDMGTTIVDHERSSLNQANFCMQGVKILSR